MPAICFNPSFFEGQEKTTVEMQEITVSFTEAYKNEYKKASERISILSQVNDSPLILNNLPNIVRRILDPADFRIKKFKDSCMTCLITEAEVSEMAEMIYDFWKEEILKGNVDPEIVDEKYPGLRPFDQLPKEKRLAYSELVYLIPVSFKRTGFQLIRRSDAEFINIESAARLARVIHSIYLKSLKTHDQKSGLMLESLNLVQQQRNDLPIEFDDLPEAIKISNIDNAYHFPTKLLSIGYRMEPWKEPETEIPVMNLNDLEIETMARIEHDRWSWDRRLSGYVYGEKRDDTARIHNCLVPFDDLSESEKEKDRAMVRLMPALIRDIGFHTVLVNTEKYDKIRYIRHDWGCITELKTTVSHLKAALPGQLVDKYKQEFEEIDFSIANLKNAFSSGRKVQSCFLPSILQFKEYLPSSFVLFKPRDIVSGDFYYIHRIENQVVVSAADCTGHSISAAILTAVCCNYLDNAVRVKKITDPARILRYVLPGIERFMSNGSHNESINFGMDFSLCCLDLDTHVLKFAGFGNPLYYISKGDFKIIKGIQSLLKYDQAKKEIITHEVMMYPGDMFYIFSDGYADQEGVNGKKFMPKQFRELLFKVKDMEPYQQCEILNSSIENWKSSGNVHKHQTDDILVIGVKI